VSSRDEEYTEYVAARMMSLRRVAFMLCQDWHRADDLVQGAITQLYLHWGRARAAEHIDAYARRILVREFLSERRSAWVRRVSLDDRATGAQIAETDQDALLDLRAALAAVPPRQRATLVLRFYCDLNVEQTARVLGCSAGTVKSQTVKGLEALRRALDPQPAGGAGPGAGPAAGQGNGRKASHG
jgi:RNA polymerase sigma-70 factor (sigma-E family)